MDLATILICLLILPVGLLFLIFISDCDLTLKLVEKFGTPTSSLKGKVVWIIGASTGIGEYLAYELVANGAKVILSGRREKELNQVKEQCIVIGRKNGLEETDILLLPLDVSQIEYHQKHFDQILNHFGTLYILVNNAGRSQRAEWQEIEMKLDREMFDVNVFGLLSLSRTVLPHFLAKKNGHIVVTSSVCGKVGAPFSATYNATKHALHGYFETARTELYPKGVAVTMLLPGPVFSDLLTACATSKHGEKLGNKMNENDRRMKTDRCAHLCAVAIANKLDEAWISINPVLFLLYVAQYAPSFARSYFARFGVRQAMKLRDGREELVFELSEEKKK